MQVLEELFAYHARHKPQALVVSRGGEIVLERYALDFTADKPHALYSGTKSFWGPVALRAHQEGLLDLDESAAASLQEWSDDRAKSKITVRQLLNLTAGFPFGGLGSAVPTYEKAIAMPLRDVPGTKFTYGGIPLQIFGAGLARKLHALKMSPHEYLHERILIPARVEVSSWRKLADGTQPLPTGAFLTARNWLAYGQYILQNIDALHECFEGSKPNPRYGLGWWLTPEGVKQDVYHASGSGGQALYVVPEAGTVIARFGGSGSFNHAAFLKRLGAG